MATVGVKGLTSAAAVIELFIVETYRSPSLCIEDGWRRSVTLCVKWNVTVVRHIVCPTVVMADLPSKRQRRH